jgi:hypothetical protein
MGHTHHIWGFSCKSETECEAAEFEAAPAARASNCAVFGLVSYIYHIGILDDGEVDITFADISTKVLPLIGLTYRVEYHEIHEPAASCTTQLGQDSKSMALSKTTEINSPQFSPSNRQSSNFQGHWHSCVHKNVLTWDMTCCAFPWEGWCHFSVTCLLSVTCE